MKALSIIKNIKMNPSLIYTAFFVFLITMTIVNIGVGYAESVGIDARGDGVGEIDWPWMKFFNSLAAQFTGPLPMTLGILGIAGCAIALFTGNAGGGTSKFILLIFVISTCLFAPTFIEFISESAGGLTILGVM